MAIQTITIDTEQWAVINRSEFIRAMDRFIRKESAEELLELIIAAAPRPVPVGKLERLCDLVTSTMLDAAATNNHSITLALEPVRDGLSALLADLLVVPPSEPRPVPTCDWQEDADGIWETSCGEAWVCTEGTPAENDMRFCHSCGKHLKEHRHAEPDGGAV